MSNELEAAVIVPSYNRPERLADCLDALVRQEGPTYEVVVVDDGSATPLAEVCERYGPKVRCIRQANRGPAAARNRGVSVTAAPFVALTDDDCKPRPDWLARLMQAHAGVDSRLVGGRVVNGLIDNPYSAASQSLCDFLYDYFGAAKGTLPFFTSNNLGIARHRFDALGGFDQTFPLAAGEDRDFGLRWRASGGEMVYVEDAVVEHYHALDLKRFLRQHSNYGRGARHLHAVMDRRGDHGPKLEAFNFYLGLVAHPMRHPGRFRLTQSALLALSQVAMVRGYVKGRHAKQPQVAREITP